MWVGLPEEAYSDQDAEEDNEPDIPEEPQDWAQEMEMDSKSEELARDFQEFQNLARNPENPNQVNTMRVANLDQVLQGMQEQQQLPRAPDRTQSGRVIRRPARYDN